MPTDGLLRYPVSPSRGFLETDEAKLVATDASGGCVMSFTAISVALEELAVFIGTSIFAEGP